MRLMTRIVAVSFLLLNLLMAFQNCSQVQFEDSPLSGKNLNTDELLSEEPLEEVDPVITEPNPPTTTPPPIDLGKTTCNGTWSACSVPCGPGVEVYKSKNITMDMQTGCSSKDNDVRSCNLGACPMVPNKNCEGTLSACSKACGGGTQKFTITSPATGNGTCSYTNNQEISCNMAPCAVPAVNCVGSWGVCNASTGTQTYNISQVKQGTGTSCAATQGQVRSCAVNCVGAFGACNADGTKIYIQTTTAKNGGAVCPYQNGATSRDGCVQPAPKKCYKMRASWSPVCWHNTGNGSSSGGCYNQVTTPSCPSMTQWGNPNTMAVTCSSTGVASMNKCYQGHSYGYDRVYFYCDEVACN